MYADIEQSSESYNYELHSIITAITELTNEKAHFFRRGMIVSLVWGVHYLLAPFFATYLNMKILRTYETHRII